MSMPGPTPLKLPAYGVAAAFIALLGIHYLVSLPDALERAREGMRRTREAPCQVLKPSPYNQVLGKLPQPAPDFTLPDHDGKMVSLSSLKGRVVLVNFWATWCPTCVVEMPSLAKLTEQLKGKPFTTLAVSVDSVWEPVRKFFPQGTPMSVLLDKNRDVPGRYGTEKFPETFLVDPDGMIRYYVISERQNWHSSEVRACLEALMD